MPLEYPQPSLTDGVVVLRPWEDRDLPILEAASKDDYVAEIEHLPVPFSETAGRAWIEAQHTYLTDDRGWTFAVVEVETAELVGGVGILFRHPPGAAEPGAGVIEDKRNRGMAQRAAKLLCHWALTADTGIARIQATVELWNQPSQRVLEKLGFVREGILRSYVSWRGDRQDVFLYSLLASDLK